MRILRREDLQAREARELAPYAMRSQQTRGRAREEPEDPRRTCYQRDRDRVIHANAFRRLQGKTQVFLHGEGDHYRSRLTHTLEVAQIARSIARTLALHEDLTETIALAHDLGHSPFGHSGGDALHAVMAAHGGFEHNRQSLRVVDTLAKGRQGLNLTYEVREGLAKHERFDPARSPFLEAQVADVADAIAYDAHDVDDGLRSGLIAEKDLADLAIWRRAPSKTELIDLFVTDLVDETAERLEREGIDSVDAARARKGYLVGFSTEVAREKKELQRFLFERLYRHPRVMRARERASGMLTDLFQAYLEDDRLLPEEWRAWIPAAGRERAVCDYIAGMTDTFARSEWERLS